MKTRKIKIHGLEHQFYFWGNPKNPKLFLVHGWMDTGASFDFMAQFLQKHYYCISWDIRGFGQSAHSKSQVGYFFFEYIADLHQILTQFSPQQKVTIVGHSMGGAMTTIYAGIFPERVDKIVNIEGFSPVFNRRITPGERARLWLHELKNKSFKTYRTLEEIAARLRQANPQLSLERAYFLATHLVKKVRGGYKIASDPLHKATDPYPLGLESAFSFWKDIPCPALYLLAEHTHQAEKKGDALIRRLVRERRKHLPDKGMLQMIPGTSHMIHHEKPEELAKIILDFLK